jgi:hypothetical protein
VAEDFYSVDEVARILKLTPGRIRQMLRAGELEGIAPRRIAEGAGRSGRGKMPGECRRTGEARWPGTCLRSGTESE